MFQQLTSVLSSIALTACTVVGVRTVEEPAYQIVGRAGPLEIRSYGPRIAAEAVVDGDEMAARSAGFAKVARYIFGANHARATIAMTAPVAQSTTSGTRQTIDMTAPVVQDRTADGKWRISFIMPSTYTMATLPEPNDATVRLVELPAQTMAVLRYSGTISAGRTAEKARVLRAALDGSRWTPTGEPVAWFYDPPWTLPFLRRNEVAVPVTSR